MAVPSFTSVEALLTTLAHGLHPPAGAGPLTERVTPLEHHLQCAHWLRIEHPADLELQVAGLVHDIGHALTPGDEAGHGRTGASAVRSLLGQRVARLVELHVPAKRYLTATDADYRGRLSPASMATLVAQGGSMSPEEAGAFAADPDASAALVLRMADEAAKEPGRTVPTLHTWRPTIEALARQTCVNQ